jgi:hypothetical protein
MRFFVMRLFYFVIRTPRFGELCNLLKAGKNIALADKGFLDPYRQQLLKQRTGVTLVAAVRRNMKEQHPAEVAEACKRWRKVVETVGSHLTE